MSKKYENKMMGNDSQGESSFHFSGAGSNLAPVVIKARTREEAESKWVAMNAAAKSKPTTIPAPDPVNSTSI